MMKSKPLLLLGAALCCPFTAVNSAFAQTTAFTYQGRLTEGTNPANGNHDLRFYLRDASSGGSPVGTTNTLSAVGVTNGLFTALLDFGEGVFTGPDLWLEMGVRTNGGGAFITLNPRQQLTPVPYAITASNLTGALPASQLSGMLPSSQLSGTYSELITLNNAGNSFTGNGAGLANVNAVALGGYGYCSLPCYWNLTGNAGSVPGVNFVGTTDNQALELKVNSARAFRLEPNATSPNVIGGFSGNYASNSAVGATISGGGRSVDINRVLADFATVGGGRANEAGGESSTIGGGNFNVSSSFLATVGGGAVNRASAIYSTVAGGVANRAVGDSSTVGGGGFNLSSGFLATVGGGGGAFTPNTASGDYATVSGGQNNTAEGGWTIVAGGATNYASALAASIAGGLGNTIQSGASYASIGGGELNTIWTNANNVTISGGHENSASGSYAAIGGGEHNGAFGFASTVSGGRENFASGSHAAIGGGERNNAAGGTSTVGGGYANRATSFRATVSGGELNEASGAAATVAGGDNNIASGYAAVIGGGEFNIASNNWATVPGGLRNTATYLAFAAGYRAKAIHTGAFVWNDSQGLDFASTASDQFLIRAAGGVGIGTASPDSLLHIKNSDNEGGAIRIGGNSTSLVEKKIRFGDGDFVTIGESSVVDNVMKIVASGVGIGRDASANKLEVEGDASKSVAGSWLANSDARIKRDIQPVTGALDKLSQVRLVSFRYTDEYRQAHASVEDRPYLNVVAQEFREVFPEDVKSSGEKMADGSEILQVDTYPLTIYSAAAVQELNGQVKALKNEMKRRDAENAKLKQQNVEMETRLNALEKLINHLSVAQGGAR